MRIPLLVPVALVLGGCLGAESPQSPSPTPGAEAAEAREAIQFETELGNLLVVLYPEAAPQTVALMKTYVREGYYIGREFNRVVPGHVIQITDKAGGVTDDPRTVPLETHPAYHFSAGAAGIARGSDPNSGGPEFFIMDFATSHLDGNYTVWGQVLQGQDVVHQIARVPAVAAPPPASGLLVDRVAIDAAAIRGARLVTVGPSPYEWSEYPLIVAGNVRAGEFRHSLEWPANLRPLSTAGLTWYVRPYNSTAPPPADEVTIRVAGETLPVVAEPGVPGVYHWVWTPPAAGGHEAALWRDEVRLATLRIEVPA